MTFRIHDAKTNHILNRSVVCPADDPTTPNFRLDPPETPIDDMDKDNDVPSGTPVPAPPSSWKLSSLERIHEVNKNKKKQLRHAQRCAPKMPAPAPNDIPSAPTPVELLDAELVPPPELAAFAPADVAVSPEPPDTVYEHSSDAGGLFG